MKSNQTIFFSALIISVILLPIFVFIYLILANSMSAQGVSTLGNSFISGFVVLRSTFLQASLSAFLSVLFGIFGSLGLCFFFRYRKPYYRSFELLCFLPALLPPLVSVLAWVNVTEVFFSFPFSFYSVLVVHVCMNIGLVSVFFSRLFITQVGSLSQWAFLHGVSGWEFLKKIIFFELKKDVILIFLLIFSFCFTSFSVPLLIGGVSGQTLEVFIAEKLKDPTTWAEAMVLFLIEFIFIFIFFSVLYKIKQKDIKITDQKNKLYLLPSIGFIVLPILPSILIFFGMGNLFVSPDLVTILISIKATIFTAWVQTLMVGIGTGFCMFLGLSAVLFCMRDILLRRFLVSYSGSSTAFMGFAFLLIPLDAPVWVLLKWSVGLSLLFLPTLYRFMGESLVKSLRTQIILADFMGASRQQSFFKIIWPQCLSTLFFLSGIAAFWACGDFAYSSIVAAEQWNLALLIQDLFSTYRFELATVLLWLLILTGVFCFSLFAGVAFVLHKKSDL